MAEKTSTDQYGRKKWDVEAYEAEARQGSGKSEANYPASDALRRKLKQQTFLQHRAELVGHSIGEIALHTLIGADRSTTSTFGRKKRFGFVCPTCDVSFRDTLALVDHFNSPQHLQNVRKITGSDFAAGEDLGGGAKRASVAQVVQTMDELVKALLRKKASLAGGSPGLSLEERVQKRLLFEENRAKKRKERKMRRSTKENGGPNDAVIQTEVGKFMGFEGFGTTKTE